MRAPRLTIGRLMIAVAVLTALGSAAWELSGARSRRRDYLAIAAKDRRYEAGLCEAAARFGGCPPDHAGVDRGSATCPRCRSAWDQAPLNHTVRTPAEAVAALESSAALLGRWAERFERGGARPWATLSRPTWAEYRPFMDLTFGYGPINKGFFDAY